MSQPFYVSPEQLMKDRADFARKGVARGRAVVVVAHAGGISFAGENPSRALHKVSEIYDRIAFAAVGKYNEFENLRVAGVRYADLRGYSYDRSDVTARGLANAYAQTLGAVFTEQSKPYEVELVVAELGARLAEDQLYRLTYDGSVVEEHGFVAMGAGAEQITTHLRERWSADLDEAGALRLAVAALAAAPLPDGATREIAAESLEVATLVRGRPRRAFRRPDVDEVRSALAAGDAVTTATVTAATEPVTAGAAGPDDGAATQTDRTDSMDQPDQPDRPDQPDQPGQPGRAD